MDTCPVALNWIQAHEAGVMQSLNVLPYSEGALEILGNVQAVQAMIKHLNTMIYEYGLNCDSDVSELSRLRKDFERRQCENWIDEKFLCYPKKSLCHQEGYLDLKEKYEQEGCEILLSRIESGQVAMAGGLKWLAEGKLNEGYITNIQAIRSALELLKCTILLLLKNGLRK